jgi:uncharacterized protein (DUF302 family)
VRWSGAGGSGAASTQANNGPVLALTEVKDGVRSNMKTTSVGRTYVIAEHFDKALKRVRRTLAERELSVTSEWETTENRPGGSSQKPRRSRLLLVDSPILMFEAMALDRAAGALFPLHVLLSADGDRTQAVFVEPATLFALRPPIGAAGPLEEMKARIRTALESAAARSEARHAHS